ncbi:hypothetical protein KY386_02265 [Candidatus Parcubacteria bacterium]|nr:hypothetical protein [Candidatus Parcubacteria bacterium]
MLGRTPRPPRPAPLPSAWRLLRGSLGVMKRRWRPLVGITAVGAVTTGLLSASRDLAADPALAVYRSLATLVMNTALIWAVIRLHQGQPVTLRSAYYSGTAALVRFMLVALVLALQLVPLAAGAIIYDQGTGSAAVAVSLGERLLLGLIWLVLALPTLYWLTRSIFSLYIVQEPEVTPVQALRRSTAAVRGRTLAVARRLLVLAVLAVVVMALPPLALAVTVGLRQPFWLLALLQLATSLVLLPLAAVYGYRLYRALEITRTSG